MNSYAEFWPYYLREHRSPTTRALHFIGTSLGILVAVLAVVLREPRLAPVTLVCGYSFAWVGHFFVEHNRPATFKYPLWSFVSDFKMLGCLLTGKLAGELERAGVRPG